MSATNPNHRVGSPSPTPTAHSDANEQHDNDHDKTPSPPTDIRHYLHPQVSRFLGYRPNATSAPFEPFPLPPFRWVKHLPMKAETLIWSTIGSFVGIALIEIVMSTAFVRTPGNLLIVAAFGAGAVLVFCAFEAPLAQPKAIIGGSLVSSVISVGLTKLFRLSGNYAVDATERPGELHKLVWVNGALSMSISLLAMQLIGCTHPPGGAVALIASTQPAAQTMSWRYVYIVMVSACLELGWALVWNNLGRRKYPQYWFSPTHTVGPKVFGWIRSRRSNSGPSGSGTNGLKSGSGEGNEKVGRVEEGRGRV